MKKRILKLLLGFLIAFIAAFGFYQFQLKVFEPVTIYETTRVILRGDTIKEGDWKTTTLYGGNINSNYITDPLIIKDKFARYDFAKGEYFKLDKISDNYSADELFKETLDKGEIAIAINTDLSQAVGGIIKAGNKVNIIAINRDASGQIAEAQTIIQNVEVLSIANRQGDKLITTNNSTSNNNVGQYSDKTPAVTVVKVPIEKEGLLAVHREVILSLNPEDYTPYQPIRHKNIFVQTNNQGSEQ